jgi:hypothetical protein
MMPIRNRTNMDRSCQPEVLQTVYASVNISIGNRKAIYTTIYGQRYWLLSHSAFVTYEYEYCHHLQIDYFDQKHSCLSLIRKVAAVC